MLAAIYANLIWIHNTDVFLSVSYLRNEVLRICNYEE